MGVACLIRHLEMLEAMDYTFLDQFNQQHIGEAGEAGEPTTNQVVEESTQDS